MDINEIRKHIILALFSDDVLYERLVLKGANALEFVHNILSRGSIDVDFSIPDEFEDNQDTSARIQRALRKRFNAVGYRIFDFEFELRPSVRKEGLPEYWGGYQVKFKLISLEKIAILEPDIETHRRNALEVDSSQRRVFKIDISKYEYCELKEKKELSNQVIYVYSVEMLLAEKLRAICQQLLDYPYGTKSPRARDFFDIHEIITKSPVLLQSPQFHDVVRSIFAAKNVELSLISKISLTRDFHAPDWPQVAAATGATEHFDYYFDYVNDVVLPALQPLWDEKTP